MSGAKLRDYFLARALGQQGQLTWLFYQDNDAVAPVARDLPFCHRLIPLPRPPLYSFGKLVQGVAGRWSLPVANYTSPQMIKALQGLPDLGGFDLVHVDCVHMAACVEAIRPHLGQTPIFYNWHNIESELMLRYSQGQGSWPRRRLARLTARRLEHDEAHILRTAAGHVVCSEREQQQLRQQAPDSRIAVVENGVDAAAHASTGTSGERRRVVFVGSMSYHANADGAVWFATELWPRIHQHFPDWTLSLVGSDPGPSVRALGELAGVEVTGTVADVRPYYRDAVAAVVPLRVGGGTRLKIIEAMAAGVPVVSTATGAEGLAVEPGREFLLASEPGQWLELLKSLQEPGRADQLIAAGRELVRRRYDWEVIGNKLVATYKEWLSA